MAIGAMTFGRQDGRGGSASAVDSEATGETIVEADATTLDVRSVEDVVIEDERLDSVLVA